jgi:hypothetical protein
MLAGALAAALLGAFHDGQNQVRVVRTAGGLNLPPLDRTMTNPQTISRLASDVRGLPTLPADEHCPADLGTLYTLTFVQAGNTWSAVIHAQGCEAVQLSTGETLWAVKSPALWSDLMVALRMSSSEVNPVVCVGATRNVAGKPCVPPA